MDDFNELEETVENFIASHGLECGVLERLLDLSSELGELTKEALKSTDYGKKPFTCSKQWEDEMGDVFFSLLCLASSSGVDLEAALSASLKKYTARLTARGKADSGR
jgi:NTP pyrophosphatase (non-canonical NTP hydrolase)